MRVRSERLRMLLDLDISKEDMAGVRLQSDKPRRRWLTTVGIIVDEVSLLLAVQKDREAVVLDPDFKLIPLTGASSDDALVEVLIGDVINRPCRTEFRVHVLAWRRAAAAKGVDLYFESEIHGDECGVVVAFAVEVGKTDEDSGIVVLSPCQPFKLEDVIREIDLRIEEA